VLETGGMEESLLSKDEDFEDNFTGVNNFFNFEGVYCTHYCYLCSGS